MQKRFTILTILLLGFLQNPIAQVIPAPQHQHVHGESFSFTQLILSDQALTEQELPVFRDYAHVALSIPLVLTSQTEGINVRMVALKENRKEEDYYEIVVDETGMTLNYTSPASKLYAWLTLVQLAEMNADNCRIPFCEVQDYPRFSWRGLHLDVARHFFSVAEVKRFIDLMAFYKFNTFHWHLTDDQGWRIEIKKYPLLTEIGGYRDSTIIGHYNAVPRTWEHRKYGGFYTQDEIREVVSYAQQRHITVVPEIEMPGHSRAALAAYPELSCTGIRQPVPGLWGIFEDIYCSRPQTIHFMQDVLAEVIELFPGEYLHIGGDEAPKTRWQQCADCQQVMRENGLDTEHDLQSYFIGQMDAFLTAHGKKLIGWDEILEGGLSPNAAVMSWRGAEGGIEAALQGHPVVMSPTSHCYFDYYQSGSKTEPLAIGGFLPLEKVYAFHPVPEQIPSDKVPFVIGAQANLWTEYIQDFKQVEYMVYPRALAMSQNVWTVDKTDYERFLSDFSQRHEPILQRWGVNYARSVYLPEIRVQRFGNGINVRLKGLHQSQHFDVLYKEKGNTAMNNRMVMGVQDSVFLERTLPGVQREVSLSITGEEFPERIEQKFVLHNALGLPVKLLTEPAAKYNNGGSLTLVDGIRGDRPWKGSQWLGFDKHQVDLELQLQEVQEVKLVTIGFLDAKGSWIYLPQRVVVRASKNGKSWKTVGEFSISSENQELPLNIRASHLRFEIFSLETIPAGAEGAGYVPWTFIDELQVILEE